MEEKEVYVNVNRWVSVNERLPEEDLIVLVAIEGRKNEPVWFGFLENGKWLYECGMPVVLDVTHWMELPAPPAVKA